jgi:hypothetical protein
MCVGLRRLAYDLRCDISRQSIGSKRTHKADAAKRAVATSAGSMPLPHCHRGAFNSVLCMAIIISIPAPQFELSQIQYCSDWKMADRTQFDMDHSRGGGKVCKGRSTIRLSTINQLIALVGGRHFAVGTTHCLTTFGKVGFRRPQRIIRNGDHRRIYFCVSKAFSAVLTKQKPLRHSAVLLVGAGPSCTDNGTNSWIGTVQFGTRVQNKSGTCTRLNSACSYFMAASESWIKTQSLPRLFLPH